MSPVDPNCLNKWWLFEVPDRQHWLYEGMSFPEMFHLNQEQSNEARNLCLSCPLMWSCIESTIKEDIEFSIRGGFGPTTDLKWDSDGAVHAPQCAHNQDGMNPTCGACLHSARKTRDHRLQESTK